MDMINHGMTGYRMPAYMEEILTRNYCPCFIRMSMIRDEESYRFSYRPGNLKRIKTDALDTADKLVLIRTVLTLTERASGYLIKAENYLIEPELLFTSDNRLTDDRVKILFYPDVKRIDQTRKIVLFSDRLRSQGIRNEEEIFDQIRGFGETGDLNRIRLLLDKNIFRMGGRAVRRAG